MVVLEQLKKPQRIGIVRILFMRYVKEVGPSAHLLEKVALVTAL